MLVHWRQKITVYVLVVFGLQSQLEVKGEKNAEVGECGQLRQSHLLTPATPSAGRGFGSDLAILGANPRRQ